MNTGVGAHTATLRAARASAGLAAGLGLPYAALNLYWALGGENPGGTGRSAVAPAVVAIGMLVTVVAGLAATGRRYRAAWNWTAWAAATGMTTYGALLVLFNTPDPLDSPVYRWHAYLFDPWYALWGVTLGTALLLAVQARESDGRAAVRPRPRVLQLSGQA